MKEQSFVSDIKITIGIKTEETTQSLNRIHLALEMALILRYFCICYLMRVLCYV